MSKYLTIGMAIAVLSITACRSNTQSSPATDLAQPEPETSIASTTVPEPEPSNELVPQSLGASSSGLGR